MHLKLKGLGDNTCKTIPIRLGLHHGTPLFSESSIILLILQINLLFSSSLMDRISLHQFNIQSCHTEMKYSKTETDVLLAWIIVVDYNQLCFPACCLVSSVRIILLTFNTNKFWHKSHLWFASKYNFHSISFWQLPFNSLMLFSSVCLLMAADFRLFYLKMSLLLTSLLFSHQTIAPFLTFVFWKIGFNEHFI